MSVFGRACGADFGAKWSELSGSPTPSTTVGQLSLVYPSMSILYEQTFPAKNFETHWGTRGLASNVQ